MIKNSKCFTDMTAHILEQLLRLLLDGKPFPAAQQLGCTGSTFTPGTSAGQSEVLVQVWAQNGTTPVILNDAFTNV